MSHHPENLSDDFFAPVAVFCFNRPMHTSRTLNALKRAKYSDRTELYIFIDGPKNKRDVSKINHIRAEIEKINGFKSINIKQNFINLGLAENIVSGITSLINLKGRLIVLEDDIVVSENFLVFMNEALTRYSSDTKIWHIGAYNLPIEFEDNERVFFWRVMQCWGWATWKDRWQHFEKNSRLLLSSFSNQDILKFNLDGSEAFFAQIIKNHENEIDTWAIFWYATIFKNNGLCVNPAVSLVQNIGLDGSGVNSGLDYGKYAIDQPNKAVEFKFPSGFDAVEDIEITRLVKYHYQKYNDKNYLFNKILYHLKKIIKFIF